MADLEKKERVDLKTDEGEEKVEEINLTLRELQEVARGKAALMMQEAQELSQESRVLIKREIPLKFIEGYQNLAEIFIILERVLSELRGLVPEDESIGLFDQFKEFSEGLQSRGKEDTKDTEFNTEPLKSGEVKQVEFEGMPVEIKSDVEVTKGD